jgi:hypothetical protein
MKTLFSIQQEANDSFPLKRCLILESLNSKKQNQKYFEMIYFNINHLCLFSE